MTTSEEISQQIDRLKLSIYEAEEQIKVLRQKMLTHPSEKVWMCLDPATGDRWMFFTIEELRSSHVRKEGYEIIEYVINKK